MARTPATTSPKYDAEALYQVQLTRPVPIPGGRFLLPIHRHKVKGRLLATFEADAIGEAVPVTAATAD